MGSPSGAHWRTHSKGSDSSRHTIPTTSGSAAPLVRHSYQSCARCGEGAFGLGGSKLQVTMRVVFPAALSGIVASVVLGFSRAVGETMVVVIAAGLQPQWGTNLGKAMETMTAFIAATAKGDIATGSIAYKTIFAVGTTLFVITFVMNLISIRFVRKYRQVYE